MIEIIHNEILEKQSKEFIYWFNEEIIATQKLDFSDTCMHRDEFGRPKKWYFTIDIPDCNFSSLDVEAIYITENENYQFNYFNIL